MADCGDNKVIETEILWNAPMHSWLGTAEEAVEFLVILAKQYYNLGLTGQSSVCLAWLHIQSPQVDTRSSMWMSCLLLIAS